MKPVNVTKPIMFNDPAQVKQAIHDLIITSEKITIEEEIEFLVVKESAESLEGLVDDLIKKKIAKGGYTAEAAKEYIEQNMPDKMEKFEKLFILI